MSMFEFQFKKIGKKKLNLILIILMILFITLIYKGGLVGAYFLENPEYRKQELIGTEGDIEFFSNKLEKQKQGTKEYNEILYNLNISKRRAELLKERTKCFNQKDWENYFQTDEELVDISIELTTKYNEDKETIDVLTMNKKYDQYMAQHSLSYDNRFAGIQGVSFMIYIVKKYLPLLLSILLIFIASNLYCSNYIDCMDLHNLLPINKIKKQASKLFVGASFGWICLLFIAIISIAFATFIEHFGSFHSPVLTYTLNGASNFISFLEVLPQLIILSTLVIFFIVNLVSVVSIITKRNTICLILTLALILGGMWATTNIIPLNSIIHFIPTTYFSSLKVITGEMMNVTGNAGITFINGFFVLGIGNIILFILYYVFSNFSLRSVIRHA